MVRYFPLVLAVLLIFNAAVNAQQIRDVRNVPYSGAPHVLTPSPSLIDDGENQDTLRYEDPDPVFIRSLYMPDDWDDHYFNVRFTPLYAPFYLLEAHIAIYDLEGDAGQPGLKMIALESGDKFGIPGYPTEFIDSVAVPFEDLVFTTWADSIHWNYIDLRSLRISYYDERDFHLAVEPILSDTLDTLAVLMDDGRYTPGFTRSGWFYGGEWVNLHDDLRMSPYNFFIHAVITPERPVGWGVPGEKSRRMLPTAIMLNPAYPNPFNDRTTISFIVAPGQPYVVSMFDRRGRQVAVLDRGLGGEARSLSLKGRDLSSGVYFLQVRCPGETRTTELQYLR